MDSNANNARSTLRRVAEQLLTLANEGCTGGATNSTIPVNNPSSNASVPFSAPAPASMPQTEHQRVFNYSAARSVPNFKPTTRQPPTRHGKRGKKKIQTCTLKFFCLANVEDEKPPATVAGKAFLSNLGLGPGSITLDLNGDALTIHENLLQRFPPLSLGGGYELLLFQRGGDEQGFHKIPTPYTPSSVKEIAGQAQIYVRPLQKSINPSDNPHHAESSLEIEKGPFIECLECHEDVRMHELNSHIEEVHGNSRKRPVNIDDFMHGDSDFNHPTGSKQTKSSSTCSTSVPTDLSMPGPSSVQSEGEKLMQLIEMFPACNSDELRGALNLHGTVARAALSLSSGLTVENDDSDSDLLQPAFLPTSDVVSDSLPPILANLQSNFSNEREKLKVDEDDLLNDAFAYYKDSTFDAKKKVRVIYRGQPAADTGGVTRQFYTQLLELISEEFFHGSDFKSPIYSSEIVASGMMKLIGTIIVHSILQGGPGLPVFSPSVYQYLASGDIDTIVQRISINDCSAYMKHFINKVAESHDVSSLDKEETANILSECGLTVTLTNENKMRVIQSVIIHDVIGRPKIVLDQLREGLGTLGFGAKMKQFPDLFQELFVYKDNELSDGDVIGILQFPTAMSMDESTTKGYLIEFVKNAPQETLIKFLLFTTGSPRLPNFGLGRIEIKFESVSSIFASTCLQSLTLPPAFPDKSTFFSSIEAVLSTASKSFNCV